LILNLKCLNRKRNDRISDFWKVPHKRIRITYVPSNPYSIYHVPRGQTLRNVSITLHPSQEAPNSAVYFKTWHFSGEVGDNQEITDTILKSIVGPRPLGSEWTKLADVTNANIKDDILPVIIPIPDIIGPKTATFIADDARVIIHGNLSDSEPQTLVVEETI
jgi:hypothetical protein